MAHRDGIADLERHQVLAHLQRTTLGFACLGHHVFDRWRRNFAARELHDVGVSRELRSRLREHAATIIGPCVMPDNALDVGAIEAEPSPPRAPGGRHPCRT
jgi:hypothetical protein